MLLDSALLRRLMTYFIRLPANFGARVYRDSDFVHNSTGNWLAVDFNTERWDTANAPGAAATTGFWLAANPTRLTAQKRGWHTISGHASFAANAVGYRAAAIGLNGPVFIAMSNNSALADQLSTTFSVSTKWWLEASDYVELYVWQNSGGNLNVTYSAAYSPEFVIVRIP